MKVLVFGGNGFVGRAIQECLRSENPTVSAQRRPVGIHELHTDLTRPETIVEAIKTVQPDVIVNAAGVVENTEAAKMNIEFTKNILEAMATAGATSAKLIISGSAAEYGEVEPSELPVKESTRLCATSLYGKCKVEEELFATEFAKAHGINLVVARIFNPIGAGMHHKFLIPQLLRQIDELKRGSRTQLEVSRLDSRRDYLDVRDIASAIKALADNPTSSGVYNIGSGISTSNGELLDIILKQSGVSGSPAIVESNPTPEATVAIQADISRLRDECGWKPQWSLDDTIKGIIDAE